MASSAISIMRVKDCSLSVAEQCRFSNIISLTVRIPRVWTPKRAPTVNSSEHSISTHGHHQMVNIKIRLIIFFAAKMEKLHTVSKNKTGS